MTLRTMMTRMMSKLHIYLLFVVFSSSCHWWTEVWNIIIIFYHTYQTFVLILRVNEAFHHQSFSFDLDVLLSFVPMYMKQRTDDLTGNERVHQSSPHAHFLQPCTLPTMMNHQNNIYYRILLIQKNHIILLKVYWVVLCCRLFDCFFFFAVPASASRRRRRRMVASRSLSCSCKSWMISASSSFLSSFSEDSSGSKHSWWMLFWWKVEDAGWIQKQVHARTSKKSAS